MVWNKTIEKEGEHLRKLYLYQIEDNKNLVNFLIAIHNKKKTIKNKILKLTQCLDV
jgi:hypothetical protein